LLKEDLTILFSTEPGNNWK